MVAMMTTSWLVINRMEIACPEKKDTMALNLSLDSSIPKKKSNGNQAMINVCKWNSESDHPVWKNDDHERVGCTPVVLQIKWDIEQEEKITWPTSSVKTQFKWIPKQRIDGILLSSRTSTCAFVSSLREQCATPSQRKILCLFPMLWDRDLVLANSLSASPSILLFCS